MVEKKTSSIFFYNEWIIHNKEEREEKRGKVDRMKPAVFDIIRQMDIHNMELQIVLQCAPVIAGIKMSNLCIIPTKDLNLALCMLKQGSFHYFLLRKDTRNSTILLYYPEKIQGYLQQEKVGLFMKQLGYTDCRLEKVFMRFQIRYRCYMEHPQDFPHEMGILLGYPLEDVTGFIKNKGKNYLYIGYWKVYENFSDKISLFHQYEMVKEQQVLLIADGMKLSNIMELYKCFRNANEKI